MFKHQGKTRTLGHNLKIASLLSFVAGLVNITGVYAIQRLTTNVTGHFAFFIRAIFNRHFQEGSVYFLYVFFFFLGSFISSLLIEAASRKSEQYTYVIPAAIECAILLIIGLKGNATPGFTNALACCLLFAMGLQNALATVISNTRVRTTHVTGLFTDLGIELSQLFFYKEKEQKKQLLSSLKLRLTILSFFFIGGLSGGALYSKIKLKSLLVAAVLLAVGLLYDTRRFKFILLGRKLHHGAEG